MYFAYFALRKMKFFPPKRDGDHIPKIISRFTFLRW